MLCAVLELAVIRTEGLKGVYSNLSLPSSSPSPSSFPTTPTSSPTASTGACPCQHGSMVARRAAGRASVTSRGIRAGTAWHDGLVGPVCVGPMWPEARTDPCRAGPTPTFKLGLASTHGATREPNPTSTASAMSSSNGGKKPASGGRGGPTIRTLADINRGPSGFPGGGGSDSDSDEPQEYYTGGEKSGMLVQDPTKKNNVDSIFEQAREMGAQQAPLPPFDGQSSSSRSFTGTGRLLSGETVPSAPQPSEDVLHNINFWNNGFTIDDGPLRGYDDPENADCIESIKKSQCPQELEPTDRRTSVHVNVIKRYGDYEEPARPRSSFQGVGRTLGGGSSADESSAPAPATQEPQTASRSIGIVVDDSLPFTSIQLRLVDGTRMVARFNTHHTVADIRSFIDASWPGAARPYQLQTGFPPKQLTDLTQTVEQAGLKNSVIMQKM